MARNFYGCLKFGYGVCLFCEEGEGTVKSDEDRKVKGKGKTLVL